MRDCEVPHFGGMFAGPVLPGIDAEDPPGEFVNAVQGSAVVIPGNDKRCGPLSWIVPDRLQQKSLRPGVARTNENSPCLG